MLRDMGVSARTKALAAAIRHWSALGGATSSATASTNYCAAALISASACLCLRGARLPVYLALGLRTTVHFRALGTK
eukprot:386360-Rhodomonas_salina.2